jgi:hypothetical protein
MDRTGMAIGKLRAVVYFENSSGHILLPPEEIGQGLALARQMWEQRYKGQGYEWKEAETWHDVTRLQQRLQEQELKRAVEMRDRSMMSYDAVKGKIASNLRQRMQSADCDTFEREFIQHYLALAPEKRAKYEQRFTEYQAYLWAVENDAGRKIEERMPSQPGEFWRNDAQQKA